MTETKKYPDTFFCSSEILAGFEKQARDTDVLTVTAAKCGQTWLNTLLYHLRNKGEESIYTSDTLMNAIPWLEIPRELEGEGKVYNVQERLAELEKIPSPRVFKMHTLHEETPIPEGCKAKMIVIYRDPRDVPYSMYKHLSNVKNGPFETNGPPPFEEYVANSWVNNTYYFKHLKSFWPHRNDDNILFLKYEDMRKDPIATATKIVKFLGWEVSKEGIAKSVEYSSFQQMQDKEKSILRGMGFPNGNFVREGGVGKNCARLTPALEDLVLSKLAEELPKEACEFVLNNEVTENSKRLRDESLQSKLQDKRSMVNSSSAVSELRC